MVLVHWFQRKTLMCFASTPHWQQRLFLKILLLFPLDVSGLSELRSLSPSFRQRFHHKLCTVTLKGEFSQLRFENNSQDKSVPKCVGPFEGKQTYLFNSMSKNRCAHVIFHSLLLLWQIYQLATETSKVNTALIFYCTRPKKIPSFLLCSAEKWNKILMLFHVPAQGIFLLSRTVQQGSEIRLPQSFQLLFSLAG